MIGALLGGLARGRRDTDWRVVHQICAWTLGYPDERMLEQLPLLREALAEQTPSVPVTRLLSALDTLAAGDPDELRSAYVELFDLHRSQTLYLSYWTDGDTRRRGETLAGFKRRYRDSGFLVDTGGELPDYLPMVLEYAAMADPVGGAELLQEYRPSLELIRLALLERPAEQASAYADVLTALCATLPGDSPTTRAAVMAMAPPHLRGGPPTEAVGLDIIDLMPTRTRESEAVH
jgi:nitrate reductase delta subunit